MSPDDHARWVTARDRTVWGPCGVASLLATHWLDAQDRTYEGVPGRWHTDGAAAIGCVEGAPVVLPPGQETRRGELLLRCLTRDGAIAVRAFDPAAASRRGISRIVRAPYDPAFRVAGRFSPAEAEDTTVAVDGHVSRAAYAGTVELALGGTTVTLTVQRSGEGLTAGFTDATAGAEAHPYRSVRLAAPDADGAVTVDFNRAYLPPCAFSDHYVCVLPPAGNRWAVSIPVGELRVA